LEEKERLLHFVVIGGGPTSVEFTAELHGITNHDSIPFSNSSDFLKQDVHKWFPELEHHVKITLIGSSHNFLFSIVHTKYFHHKITQ
jgi:NADH:ubiquinone reductase (non-electrogenic)